MTETLPTLTHAGLIRSKPQNKETNQMTDTMIHEISGNNFHGGYHLRLRGPAEGFTLSPSQRRRYDQELCGVMDCRCGGGYGSGPDSDSASISWDTAWDDDHRPLDVPRLVPATPEVD